MKSKDKPARPGPKLLIGVVCLLLAFTVVPRVKTVWELSAQRTQLEQQKAVLEKVNKELSLKAKKANTPENIEKIAREQLGMVKKGEKALIQVVPENQPTE